MKTLMTRQHTRVAQLPAGARAWIARPLAPFLFLWALALLCLASATPASAQSGSQSSVNGNPIPRRPVSQLSTSISGSKERTPPFSSATK